MNKQQNRPDSSPDTSPNFEQLPGLGYLNDDIQMQLTETAKSIAQDIVDLMAEQYKKARGLRTMPENIWKPLRGKAYILAAEHCEDLAKDLRNASKNPNMNL